MMVAILVVTMAAGFGVVQWNLRQQVDQYWEQRALAVAQTMTVQPAVIGAVTSGHPGGQIQAASPRP